MDVAQSEVLRLSRGAVFIRSFAFFTRITVYYTLLGLLLFTMFAPLYLVYLNGVNLFASWRSLWDLFARNFLVFAFLFEAVIVLMIHRNFRRVSFLRLFAFAPSRETDLYFWMYFTAVYFYLPLAIAQSPQLRSIFPIFELEAHGGQLLAFLFLSFVAYAVHWLSHKIPALWELHKIHHSATDLTCITGPREHLFFEMIHVGIFILFFDAQNALVTFAFASRAFLNVIQHSQLNLKFGWLGQFVISPHTHRIHHLQDPKYFNSNFGSDITLWDRLFGTFRYEVPLTAEELEQGFGLSTQVYGPKDTFVLRELFSCTVDSIKLIGKRKTGRLSSPVNRVST